MSNTSATGGFLEGTPGRSQEELEDILHELICGLTGLEKKLIRPRWQPEAPKQPGKKTNWCAFGITGEEPFNFPVQQHDSAGLGKTVLTVFGKIHVLASFYGPAAKVLAKKLRNGLHIAQNRAFLKKHGMNFQYADPIQPVPEMAQFNWLAREDLPFTLSFVERSDFAVLNLQSAQAVLNADGRFIRSIHVEEKK